MQQTTFAHVSTASMLAAVKRTTFLRKYFSESQLRAFDAELRFRESQKRDS